MNSKEKILISARKLFWSRGYSSVSVRDITSDAGVDVSLISRHYGGKLGLFTASIEGAFNWPALYDADQEQFVDMIVTKFANSLEQTEENSSLRMLLINSMDPEVGDFIRELAQQEFVIPMQKLIGGKKAKHRVAIFLAVMVGASMMRNNLQLKGMADLDRTEYEKQLRYLAKMALSY